MPGNCPKVTLRKSVDQAPKDLSRRYLDADNSVLGITDAKPRATYPIDPVEGRRTGGVGKIGINASSGVYGQVGKGGGKIGKERQKGGRKGRWRKRRTLFKLAVKITISKFCPIRYKNSSTPGRLATNTSCDTPSISTGMMKSA